MNGGYIMVKERRKHVRVPVEDHCFVGLGQGLSKIGVIKNISIQGLAFEYMSRGEEVKDQLCEVDIFVDGQRFYLAEVQCKALYDIPVPTDTSDYDLKGTFMTRRCGVQFEDLTREQTRQIRVFLKKFTVQNASAERMALAQ